MPAAVAKWQTTPGQDHHTVCSTPPLQATGEWHHGLRVHACHGTLATLSYLAVAEPAGYQRTQTSVQSVSVISATVHLQYRPVGIPSIGGHAKGYATTDLVGCSGSCWHQPRSVLQVCPASVSATVAHELANLRHDLNLVLPDVCLA